MIGKINNNQIYDNYDSYYQYLYHYMNIRVSVRVMPLQEKEIASGYENSIDISDGSLKLNHPQNEEFNESYEFDNYFDHAASQEVVFEAIGESFIQSCIEGYACCMMFLG